MLITCFHCNTEFKRKPSEISKVNFCSRTCFKAAHANNSYHNRQGIIKQCLWCNKDMYITSKSTRKLCSRSCQGKWRSKNLIGEKASNYRGAKKFFTCEICGVKKGTYFKTTKYCSYKCHNISMEKKVTLYCKQCNKQFARPKSSLAWSRTKKYFCSPKCKKNYFKAENNPNWIADRTKLKNKIRSIRYSSEMEAWRKKVFYRDKHTCQLCKEYSKQKHRVILNAHHIKKFCDYPELRFDVNNGITLCRSCHKTITGREAEFEPRFKKILTQVD